MRGRIRERRGCILLYVDKETLLAYGVCLGCANLPVWIIGPQATHVSRFLVVPGSLSSGRLGSLETEALYGSQVRGLGGSL
jgi:hypothetical protein